ncbi:type II toxin-antitoxin system HicB family antitoxin [Phenylobacterium sp.]|uniref:type II toxin-antitoxin system HicB family antitoxin n=1 Tax=Phenylobacterium sp. TaxID=1871053 RepID=UPI002FCA83C0
MVAHTYLAVLEPSAEGVRVSFPDVPDCLSSGVDAADAIARAEQALALHLDAIARQGQPAPQPRSLSELAAVQPHPRPGSGVLWVRLGAPPPDASGVLHLPDEVLTVVDHVGADLGLSRAGVVALAMRSLMQGRVRCLVA